jgi:Cu2+-exporting ATPase
LTDKQSAHAGHDAESVNMKAMEGYEHMGHEMNSGQETGGHAGHGKMSGDGDHASHHAMMVADFRRRFWICLVISIPILLLSPLIQRFFGLEGVIKFTGDSYVLFALSSVVFSYGGYPFAVSDSN